MMQTYLVTLTEGVTIDAIRPLMWEHHIRIVDEFRFSGTLSVMCTQEQYRKLMAFEGVHDVIAD
jgi:hypothetical protein